MAKFNITVEFPNATFTAKELFDNLNAAFLESMKSQGIEFKFTGLHVEEVKDVQAAK